MKFSYQNILNIPERCSVNKRLPKKFFLKNFDLLAAEKKCVNTTIHKMEWLASLSPISANIPESRNKEYVFEEIQIFQCTLAENQLEAHADASASIFQKYIPYQILLFVEDEHEFVVNVADKRINSNDANKRTIVKQYTTLPISKLYKKPLTSAFFKALDFTQLDKTNLESAYKSYWQAVAQFQTASITGEFHIRTHKRTEQDMIHIAAIELLEKEIKTITNQLKKERQLNEKVELNILIQEKRKKIESLKDKLSKE